MNTLTVKVFAAFLAAVLTFFNLPPAVHAQVMEDGPVFQPVAVSDQDSHRNDCTGGGMSGGRTCWTTHCTGKGLTSCYACCTSECPSCATQCQENCRSPADWYVGSFNYRTNHDGDYDSDTAYFILSDPQIFGGDRFDLWNLLAAELVYNFVEDDDPSIELEMRQLAIYTVAERIATVAEVDEQVVHSTHHFFLDARHHKEVGIRLAFLESLVTMDWVNQPEWWHEIRQMAANDPDPSVRLAAVKLILKSS